MFAISRIAGIRFEASPRVGSVDLRPEGQFNNHQHFLLALSRE